MTSYPKNIDTDATLPSLFDDASEVAADDYNQLKSAIIAIEKTIGENPQGTVGDLVSRIAVAINDDGTLKSSALLAAGLIALPITK